MPLRIRRGSLIFNHTYECKPIGSEQFYVKPFSNVKISKKELVVKQLFAIRFSSVNSCIEETGINKSLKVLNNLKYYNKKMVYDAGIYFRDIPVYSLTYADDDYLVQTIKECIGIEEKNELVNPLAKLTYYKLRQKEINYITVQGYSMYPTLFHNQKISIEYIEPHKFEVGDIVVYKKFSHITVHRIIDIQKSEENLLFQTKGDNCSNLDSYYVFPDEILARVVI